MEQGELLLQFSRVIADLRQMESDLRRGGCVGAGAQIHNAHQQMVSVFRDLFGTSQVVWTPPVLGDLGAWRQRFGVHHVRIAYSEKLWRVAMVIEDAMIREGVGKPAGKSRDLLTVSAEKVSLNEALMECAGQIERGDDWQQLLGIGPFTGESPDSWPAEFGADDPDVVCP